MAYDAIMKARTQGGYQSAGGKPGMAVAGPPARAAAATTIPR